MERGLRIVPVVLILAFAVLSVCVANEYAAANNQYYQEDLRVDEKDYAVDGHSSYWLLCLPVIMIPLILLLCTPVFHTPHVPHHGHHGHHGHHDPGWGYGWGTYNLGWKRSADQNEDLTGRVMKSISSTKKKSG